MRQTCKMEKVEVRAVIKYLCKKGMTHKGIHEDFMKTLGNESPYSTVKNGLQNLSVGKRALKMMQGLAAPKIPPLMKMWRSFTTWLCVTGGEYSQRSGHKFWGSANNSNRYLGDVQGLSKMGTEDVD